MRLLEVTPQTVWQKRIILIGCIILSFFSLLFARLWYLQVTRSDFYREQAEKNRLRFIEVTAARGLILDRKHRTVVENEPAFSLVLRREFIQNLDNLLTTLERNFALPRDEMEERLAEYKSVPVVLPITLKSRLSFQEIAFVEAHKNTFPELSLEWAFRRKYNFSEAFSHIAGYTGEITTEELTHDISKRYKRGDTIGKNGMEKYYNDWLKGRNGFKKCIINSIGQITAIVEESPSIKGEDLTMAVDLDLQATALLAMQGQKGALVAMDPQTGEILCLVSVPGFDSNLFSGHMTHQAWKELAENPDKPMQNKAIQGLYAPGSVFKILVALAALGENVISPDTSFFCAGETEMLGRTVHCWNSGGHGEIRFMNAVASSCNIYFYNVGLRLGVDRIHKWADQLGMGRRTGIDLPSEKSGLVPSSEWKMKVYHSQWYKGETIPVAIGQGAVTVTPLQVATFMSAVALNRIPPQPHLRFDPNAGGKANSADPLIDRDLHQLLLKSMENVVEEGTGTKARLDGISIAGKTGTAQLISTDTAERLNNYEKEFKENSWFACFAPVEKPAIAIAVIVEHGGHGGLTAAPIAAEVLKKFFELYPQHNINRKSDER